MTDTKVEINMEELNVFVEATLDGIVDALADEFNVNNIGIRLQVVVPAGEGVVGVADYANFDYERLENLIQLNEDLDESSPKM